MLYKTAHKNIRDVRITKNLNPMMCVWRYSKFLWPLYSRKWARLELHREYRQRAKYSCWKMLEHSQHPGSYFPPTPSTHSMSVSLWRHLVACFQNVLDLCQCLSVTSSYFSKKKEHRTATPPKRLCFKATFRLRSFQEPLNKSRSIVLFWALGGF